MQIITSPFEEITRKSDVVYFEFCLHEMKDPRPALTHARSLALETVVFDHSADSEWAFYAAEDNEVQRSSEAVQSFGIRRRRLARYRVNARTTVSDPLCGCSQP